MTVRFAPRIGTLATGVALALTCLGPIVASLWPGLITRTLADLPETIRDAGSVGVFVVFVAEVLVAASGLLPASLVGIAAGAMYGVGPGFAIASASLLLGAMLTFRLTRSMLRPAIVRLIGGRRWLGDLDGLVARDGWTLVCLLRVSPVMPFAATSCSLGLTSIGTGAYLAGTLASLPALLGFVAVGGFSQALTQAWQRELGLAHIALLGVGIAATLVVTIRIGRLVRRVAVGEERSPPSPADFTAQRA